MSDATLTAIAESFSAIGLEETNASAAMLNRTDRKFVVTTDTLACLLDGQWSHYRVLEIENRRELAYRSSYFDQAYRSYYDHHQGRRKRFKIRIREYLDTDAAFFETKLKSPAGETLKHRLPFDSLVPLKLGPKSFLHQNASRWIEQAYGDPLTDSLRSSLVVDYRRMTLVANKGGERVTVDSRIEFFVPGDGKCLPMGEDFVIVETKTSGGMGLINDRLRDIGQREISKCSKYCLGLVMAGKVARFNHFLPTLRTLNLVDHLPSVRGVLWSGGHA